MTRGDIARGGRYCGPDGHAAALAHESTFTMNACYLMVSFWIACLAFGCRQGPPLGQVEGRVTLNGQPVEHATVTFQPTRGPSSYGITDHNGRYELKYSKERSGAVVGTHKITIETYRIATDDKGEVIEYPETIPAKYNVQSTLIRHVNEGSQTISFELESEPERAH